MFHIVCVCVCVSASSMSISSKTLNTDETLNQIYNLQCNREQNGIATIFVGTERRKRGEGTWKKIGVKRIMAEHI